MKKIEKMVAILGKTIAQKEEYLDSVRLATAASVSEQADRYRDMFVHLVQLNIDELKLIKSDLETCAKEDHLDQFRELVREHDVAHEYSDDPRVLTRGDAEYNFLIAFADKYLTSEERVTIWNEVMYEKFVDPTDWLMSK